MPPQTETKSLFISIPPIAQCPSRESRKNHSYYAKACKETPLVLLFSLSIRLCGNYFSSFLILNGPLQYSTFRTFYTPLVL
ncbi:hypothetical protein IFM46972_08888 [Aspergillus udagawae]|uniref:Uncharacterized protein n=1 Tax=Aspergillus udagawae TaxID=91492 RepID=A0A8H3PB82_9EURO|nr:hypothetical protein IFM46972_08888 [Aspergillus udagawae]